MAEPSNSELKELINSVLTKVTAVEGEVSSLKVDQARLHVAVNNVQSERMEHAESAAAGAKGKNVVGSSFSPSAPHKLRFPHVQWNVGPDHMGSLLRAVLPSNPVHR